MPAQDDERAARWTSPSSSQTTRSPAKAALGTGPPRGSPQFPSATKSGRDGRRSRLGRRPVVSTRPRSAAAFRSMRQRARPRTVRRPSQRCTMPVRHTPTRTQATTRGVGVARAHPRPRGFSDYTGVTADSVRPVQIRPIQAQFVKPVLDTGKTDIEHSSGHYGRWRDPDSNRGHHDPRRGNVVSNCHETPARRRGQCPGGRAVDARSLRSYRRGLGHRGRPRCPNGCGRVLRVGWKP